MTFPYSISSDTITVTIKGRPHNVHKDDPRFLKIRNGILTEDWKTVETLIAPGAQLQEWSHNKFTYSNGLLKYEGETIPGELYERMIKTAREGHKPTALMNFYERLQQNPSYRSVNQLFRFLEHEKIPLTEDGYILAYKGVRSDYRDQHSGTFLNTPGSTMKMPRNKVSDDPNTPCHEGFHVGDESYAKSFSAKVVICKVDPKDVVCVPYDANSRKVRVCEYTVIGLYGAPLPDTVLSKEDMPPEELDEGGDEEMNEAEMEEGTVEEEDEEPTEDENVGKPAPAPARHETKEIVTDEVTKMTLEQLRTYAKSKGVKNVKAVTGGKAGLLKLLETLGTPKGAAYVGETQHTVGAVPSAKKHDMEKLKAMNIGDLRKYASQKLHIVGASKIPGGKEALLEAIASHLGK